MKKAGNSSLGLDSYPHLGEFLTNYMLENKINRAEVARKMNVPNTALHKYADSPSLQCRILWNASLVLNHNFLAELGTLLPVDFITPKEEKLQAELIAKQSEIADLRKEIAIYKSILENRVR